MISFHFFRSFLSSTQWTNCCSTTSTSCLFQRNWRVFKICIEYFKNLPNNSARYILYKKNKLISKLFLSAIHTKRHSTNKLIKLIETWTIMHNECTKKTTHLYDSWFYTYCKNECKINSKPNYICNPNSITSCVLYFMGFILVHILHDSSFFLHVFGTWFVLAFWYCYSFTSPPSGEIAWINEINSFWGSRWWTYDCNDCLQIFQSIILGKNYTDEN